MKPRTVVWLKLFLLVSSSIHAPAQFYAPETEYHDKLQRLFPVELIRVLAWRENVRTQAVCRITQTVSVNAERETHWELALLDQQSRPVRTLKVSYPETLLDKGPGFYREVFRQVWTNGPWVGVTNITAGEWDRRFWAGGEAAGVAREEGLRAAFKLARATSPATEGQDAPTLSGLLLHTALPGLRGGVTLDAMLCSRAAAWLCLSEAMLNGGVIRTDEKWAPLMFMAGRENTACELWKQSGKPATSDSSRAYAWWDFFLRQPTAKDVFLFAADRRQRPFAMPMIAYHSRLDGVGGVVEELMGPLYGNDRELLLRLHNFGPFLSYSGVGAGRILEGAWPVLFRADWLRTMKDYPVGELDYQGYRDDLARTQAPVPAAMQAMEDASLLGLKELSPLLGEGYSQGAGDLIPVATVTARDLLNYGWEMNGMQMGARYIFVNRMWGIRDLAEAIFNQATRDVQGQTPFFQNDFQKTAYNLQSALFRLQMVDDLSWRVRAEVHPFTQSVTDTNAARLFHQRCWLRPFEVRWQAWTLCRAGLADEMLTLIDRYHRESGRMASVIALEYLMDWKADELAQIKGLPELKEKLAEAIPSPTTLKIKAVFDSRYANMQSGPRAQEYEKLFWQNPGSDLAHRVFIGYIHAGAYKSAKRFYLQARDVIERDVWFSNHLGPECWMLGWLTQDKKLMNTALEDSDTGSQIAMQLAFWHHVVRDDTKAMESQLDELIGRYETRQGPQSTGRRLKEFLPLLPALKDPKHRDHARALDFFGKAPTGTVFRWILITKYKLPAEEAIRFLGGPDTDYLRRVMVLSLLKDASQMRQALLDYSRHGGTRGPLVLAIGLQMELLKLPSGIEEKDLKPPGATSIRQAVMKKLEAR